MLKKVQKFTVLFVVAAGVIPQQTSPNIWDSHQAPAKFSQIVMKSILSGGVGGAAALVISKMVQKGAHDTWQRHGTSVGVVGLLTGVITYLSCKDNTPEMWLTQFFTKFNEVTFHPALSKTNLDNAAWIKAQGSIEELEELQRSLTRACSDIPKLLRVVDILLSIGLDEFRPETIVELRANKEVLIELNNLALTRHGLISVTVDYEHFQQLYARIKRAGVLVGGTGYAWLESCGVRQSFKHLRQELADLNGLFTRIDGILKRLSVAGAQPILTVDQKLELARRIPQLSRRRERCTVRLAYVTARADYEDFSYYYSVCVRDPVLQVAGIFGDDDAWFMRHGSQRNLLDVTRDLKRRSYDLQQGISLAHRLVKSSNLQYFSAAEQSQIHTMSRVLQDLLALCEERQHMVLGLQAIDDFVAEYAHVMSNGLTQESVRGASDLSWMQISRSVQWPLEDVCDRLRACKSDLSRVLQLGEDVMYSSKVQKLSFSRKNMVKTRMDGLRRAINLVEQRLTFVLHSTMYAEEVAKKRSLETYRQEELVREQRAREEARQREAQQRAAERERQRQELERALTQQGTPSEPSAPPADQQLDACFCGDDIQPNDRYVLSCPCKNVFYHKDCINRWVGPNKKCPHCRTAVTLTDVQKYTAPANPTPTAPPVQPQPAIPVPPAPIVEVEECYLCMDSDNVADCTTASCDCTVKKPACRSCLQEWFSTHNTCPRCQKTGATIVPFVRS